MSDSVIRALRLAAGGAGRSSTMLHPKNTTIKNRVLSLYRQCLQSCNKIPDPEQRQIYHLYVRNEFRHKRNMLQPLPLDSRQNLIAIRDAEEQLERMNYYHSVREAKEKQVKESQSSGRNTANIAEERKNEVAREETTREIQRRNDGMDETVQRTTQNRDSQQTPLSHESSFVISVQQSEQENLSRKVKFVKDWIHSLVPYLDEKDAFLYAEKLVRDGFDTEGMLLNELREEDLDFITKKAHRRSIVRAIVEK